jgi:hypothetical protein
MGDREKQMTDIGYKDRKKKLHRYADTGDTHGCKNEGTKPRK